MSPWRVAVGLSAAGGYALLSHWLTLRAASQPWALAALLAPVWGVATAVAVHRRQWLMLAGLAAVAVAVGGVTAYGGLGDVNRLAVLQHVGIHLALGVMFSRSLRRGGVSLIGAVALRVHGTLTPAMSAYCRRVTAAWAIYFGAMALVSVWGFWAWSWNAWSLLANLVTPVAIAALFVGEYAVRYWLHPEFERATLWDAVRAYNRATPQ